MDKLRYTISNNKSGGYFPKTPDYTYIIYTGSRCRGLSSCRGYETYDKACLAAERMIKKLGGGFE